MIASKQNGFSLLEMSLVLVILGILYSALLVPLQSYSRQKSMFEVCDEQDKIRQALLDFSVVHGRLPWAALENGIEIEGKEQGFLPWRVLSLRPENVWGAPYHYQVLHNWADHQSDPHKVEQCDIQTTQNHLSINFCSKGRLIVRDKKDKLLYDKAVAIVRQPQARFNHTRICEQGITWLGAETVLGYLVMAGRLY